MALTPDQAEAEKARRLKLLESAAASAILNGATEDEARHRVDVGIADALRILDVQARGKALAG
jgi:hypothetical protein